MDRKLGGIVAALMLTGCVGAVPIREPVAPFVNFDLQAHARYIGDGAATVKGQAFLRQNGGGVVTCAGQQVILMPATGYFQDVMRIARSGRTPTTAPPEAKQVVRRSQCDAQGNFTFERIPAGSWMVTSLVKWSVGYNAQGGGLLKNVEVPASGTVNVLLSDEDYVAP